MPWPAFILFYLSQCDKVTFLCQMSSVSTNVKTGGASMWDSVRAGLQLMITECCDSDNVRIGAQAGEI